jgi:hypothetical protein
MAIAADVELLLSSRSRSDVAATLDYAAMLEGLGSKSTPTILDIGGWPVQIHNDGASLEYAVLEPQQYAVIEGLQRNLGFELEPVDWFNVNDWPALHKSPFLVEEIQRFGCDPDYNMFGQKRIVPSWVKHSPIREHGFHFHDDLTGAQRGSMVACTAHARALAKLGWVSAWTCGLRKPWYRKAGLFRPKPYGIEYRSFGAGILADRNKFEMIVMQVFDYFRR